MKSYHIRCPKYNNNHSFYRYGKDSDGYQKYLCRNCHHQFAPDRPRSEGTNCQRKHPPCPVCGRLPFCITIMSITPTTAALTKSATIPFLYGNPLPLQLRLCQIFSENTILSIMRYSALNGLTPAQVAGLNLSKQRKREFLLVAWSFSLISWAIFSFLLYSAEFKIQPVSR